MSSGSDDKLTAVTGSAAQTAALWKHGVSAVERIGLGAVVLFILLYSFGPRLDKISDGISKLNEGIVKLTVLMEARGR